MASEGKRLAAFAEAVRGSTLKRLARVPPDHANWRPSAGAMSIADIAHHLADADRWLFRKLATPGLAGMVAEAGQAGTVSPAEFEELIEELRRTGRERCDLLRSLGEERLEQLVPDDRFGGEVTVWWVIVRGNLDHEAHHRGQLAAYLRILADGAEALDLQK